MSGPRDWRPPEGSTAWEQAAGERGRVEATGRRWGLWVPLVTLAVLVVVFGVLVRVL